MAGTAGARRPTSFDPARQVAYLALRAVDAEDAYLNLILPALMTEWGLASRDARFATELANGTVRWQGRYDAILDRCVKGGVASLQPEVLTVLRLGCHQLLAMRVSDYAAVGTTVTLVRRTVGERPVRLVNAVLRRVSASSLDEWLALLPSTAERWSHPAWVIDAFAEALRCDGADAGELELLLAADNEAPRVTLAVRPGLATVVALEAFGAQPGRFSPYAAVLPSGDPAKLGLVRSGRVGVQDEGSQLAALVLARAALDGLDRRWLDMCAGPGGKGALLTGLARERGSTLVANERQPHRALLVTKALRAFRQPVPVLAADGTEPPWQPETFDRVLVDAPCTGLGALRRRPEARWRRTPSDLEALVPLQLALLRSALRSVRPGGVVAYVTCSPHTAETRGVVDAVVAGGRDVREEDVRSLLPEIAQTGPGPHLQLWPHRHGTDAMFVALLRRR